MSDVLASVAERFTREHTGVLSERLYAAMRGAILAGDLTPGVWMKETELSASLSVSRTPLREALVRLTGEGLLDAVPNKGVVVRGVGSQELQELYEILLILESYAARLAAERATDEQIRNLIEALDLTEFYLERERWEEVTHQSVAFHAILYEASGNGELAKLIESVRVKTHAFRRFGIRSMTHLLEGLQHHRSICDAVQRHEGDLAAARMHEHVLHSVDRITDQSVAESGNQGTVKATAGAEDEMA